MKTKKPVDKNAQIATNLQKKLTREGVERLSVEEWKMVILDLICADEEMTAAFEHRKPHLFIKDILSIDAAAIIGNHDRESSPITSVTPMLEDELSAKARAVFCQALTSLASSYNIAASTGDKNANRMLWELTTFNGLLEGSVDADVVEEIVFGQADIDTRARFASQLAHRDFRSSPPALFWTRLDAIVEERPEFLHALLSYYAEARCSPRTAMDLLKKVKRVPSHPEALGFPLRSIMDELVGCEGWEDHLRKMVASSAPWLKKIFMEEVIPFTDKRDKIMPLFQKAEKGKAKAKVK